MEVRRHVSPRLPVLTDLDRSQTAHPGPVEGIVAKDASRLQHPGDLGDDFRQVAHVLQDVTAENDAERSILERKRFPNARTVPDIQSVLARVGRGGLAGPPGGIDAGRVEAHPGDLLGQESPAAADVQSGRGFGIDPGLLDQLPFRISHPGRVEEDLHLIECGVGLPPLVPQGAVDGIVHPAVDGLRDLPHSVSDRGYYYICLLYTSPSPRDGLLSR